MAFGHERSLLVDNLLKRAVVGMVGDTHFGRVLRFLYLRSALDRLPVEPQTVLDAGAGKGYLSLYLAQRYAGARIVGADISAVDLVEAERIRRAAHLENLMFVRSDLAQPVGENTYDLIVSSEVLEYVLDEEAALRNLHQSLRPGGTLLLHLMHAEGGYRQLGARRLFGVRSHEWRDTGMARAGYTEERLAHLLQRVGFEDIEVALTFGDMGMLAHSWFEVGRAWPAPLYLLLFPFLLACAYLDLRAAKTHGGGILAVGRKNAS